MSLFDEDEMDCECCGHVGLIFNGDFDVEYPVCGAEYSLIIDEAHHIKNPNTYAYQAEQMFYDNAESIVLLTATPIQLGDRDLYVLLNLIHSDLVFDYDSFKHMSEPNPFINEAAKLIGDIESLHTFAHIILFLTVSKNKIAATPENIGVVAILTVVLNYSILFPSFTFFLDGFHLAFGDKFEICIKTTDLM